MIFQFVFIFVSVPPQIAPFTFGEEPANFGDMAGVNCMAVKGDLPIDLFWTLNNLPLVADGDQGITMQKNNARTSALSIEALGAQHRGVYQCVARNRAGFSVVASELIVNGARRCI